MTISYDDYLMHHGVKGMKWGVRHDKPRTASSRVRQAKPDTRSEHRKQVDDIRAKKRHELTDEELRQAINRMNMEKQYKNLNRELYHPGQDFAMKALKTSGNIAVGAVGGYAVNSLGKKAVSAGVNVARRKGAAVIAGHMLRRAVRRG